MICSNCQKEIEADSKFCEFCGKKIEAIPDKSEIIDIDKEVLDHLEFLGYELKKINLLGKSQRYTASHNSKANLYVHNINNIGISIISIWNVDKDKVDEHRKEALEMINRMNNSSILTTFCFNNYNQIATAAFYSGKYTKKSLVDFMDTFENDIQRAFNTEDPIIKKLS